MTHQSRSQTEFHTKFYGEQTISQAAYSREENNQ